MHYCTFSSTTRARRMDAELCGSENTADFLLKKERIIAEAKMTGESLRQKRVVEQLIVDRDHYATHP